MKIEKLKFFYPYHSHLTARMAFVNGVKKIKPISRILFPSPIHVSPKLQRRNNERIPSFIWPCRRRQDLAAYPPRSSEQPSSLGLHGLTVRGVYLLHMSPHAAVGSYPTLFTLITPKADGIVSVALSVNDRNRSLPVRKRGALYCPDFPPRGRARDDGTV